MRRSRGAGAQPPARRIAKRDQLGSRTSTLESFRAVCRRRVCDTVGAEIPGPRPVWSSTRTTCSRSRASRLECDARRKFGSEPSSISTRARLRRGSCQPDDRAAGDQAPTRGDREHGPATCGRFGNLRSSDTYPNRLAHAPLVDETAMSMGLYPARNRIAEKFTEDDEAIWSNSPSSPIDGRSPGSRLGSTRNSAATTAEE